MEERQIVIGGFYRHFKNKLYQVKCIAYHSETKEKMVVYQALYGDYSVYVRPFEMFASEVDHDKYPDIYQKYRFEQVYPDGSAMPHVMQPAADVSIQSAPDAFIQTEGKAEAGSKVESEAEQKTQSELQPVQREEISAGEEGEVDPRLMKFLDADTYQDKLNVLTSLRSNLDDKLINAMAASMDVEVLEGRIEDRYMSLRRCIQTQVKYECATRLR